MRSARLSGRVGLLEYGPPQPVAQGGNEWPIFRVSTASSARSKQGQPAFTGFSPAEIDSALAMSASKYDGVVFEMEHNPWDGRALRDRLQYMLNRAADREGRHRSRRP